MALVTRVVSFLAAAGAMALCVWAVPAQAGLVLQSTRLVIPSDSRDVTLAVRNTGNGPVLAQSWLDDGRADVAPADLRVPFVLAPAVVRVDPDSGAVLRISYTQDPLPTDRESLFYLNILETPPRDPDQVNVLAFQFRSRIKVFFRPTSLRPRAVEAPAMLTWKLAPLGARRLALEVDNPSPYYVSLAHVDLMLDGERIPLDSGMVAPFEKSSFALPEGVVRRAGKAFVDYEIVNDYGGLLKVKKPLSD